MNICIQCDQEVDEVQVISHCGDCIVFNTNEIQDYMKLLEAEHADLCEQNAKFQVENDELKEELAWRKVLTRNIS
jgi:hypothetical protein